MTAIYEKYTVHWFHYNMRKYFPEFVPKEYIDPVLIMFKKECRINIVKLDDMLHLIHGEYEEMYGINMKVFVWLFYSEEAAKWLESAI